MKTIPCILLACLVAACSPKITSSPETATSKSLLWEITSNDGLHKSYLFGTFHLLCKEDIILSDSLKHHIKNTHSIFLEMDLEDPAIMFNAMKFIMMRDGKELKDLYSADDYKKINLFFKDSLNINITSLVRMKPALLEVLIYPKIMDCKTSEGMETAIMALAKSQNIPIHGLETMAEQSAVFDSIPYQIQATDLLEKIDSLDKFKIEFRKVYQAYMENDLDALLSDDLKTKNIPYEDFLLNNRNKKWAATLVPALENDNILIAVGAGHLPGEEGLISLLRKNGFALRPVQNTIKK
ncbi:MAG: TraB/GumN family protein [Ferruginibacter sp.]